MPSDASGQKPTPVVFPGDEAGNAAAMELAQKRGNITHHFNLDSNRITINEERLVIHLRDWKEELLARHSWSTPAGIVLTLFATAVTADVRPVFGLSAEQVRTVFWTLFVLSGAWLLINLIRLVWRGRSATVKNAVKRVREDRP